MDGPIRHSGETLVEYRVRKNEDAIKEIRKTLAEDYLDVDQLQIQYIPRQEHVVKAQARREWPLITATVVMSLTSLANFIVLASHS